MRTLTILITLTLITPAMGKQTCYERLLTSPKKVFYPSKFSKLLDQLHPGKIAKVEIFLNKISTYNTYDMQGVTPIKAFKHNQWKLLHAHIKLSSGCTVIIWIQNKEEVIPVWIGEHHRAPYEKNGKAFTKWIKSINSIL